MLQEKMIKGKKKNDKRKKKIMIKGDVELSFTSTRKNMAAHQLITQTFSYSARPSNTAQPSIFLRIKRPQTQQSDQEIQMPLLINTEGQQLSLTVTRNVEFLLNYHQIPESEAVRVTQWFTQFANVVLQTENGGGMLFDLFLTVTDNNFHAQALIGDLQTSVRAPLPEEENEECTICLQTFKGREDLTTTACSHKYHQECIVQWIRINKSCPICRTPYI